MFKQMTARWCDKPTSSVIKVKTFSNIFVSSRVSRHVLGPPTSISSNGHWRYFTMGVNHPKLEADHLNLAPRIKHSHRYTPTTPIPWPHDTSRQRVSYLCDVCFPASSVRGVLMEMQSWWRPISFHWNQAQNSLTSNPTWTHGSRPTLWH